MTDMFCFQCQQTAGNKGCIRTGVCGKQPTTANLQDKLVYELISLAEMMVEKDMRTKEADRLFIDGLFTTLTNVNFDNEAIENFIKRIVAERNSVGDTREHNLVELWNGDTDIVSLRSTFFSYFSNCANAAATSSETSISFVCPSANLYVMSGI